MYFSGIRCWNVCGCLDVLGYRLGLLCLLRTNVLHSNPFVCFTLFSKCTRFDFNNLAKYKRNGLDFLHCIATTLYLRPNFYHEVLAMLSFLPTVNLLQ